MDVLILHRFVILIDNLFCLLIVFTGNGDSIHFNATNRIQRGKGSPPAIIHICFYFCILQQALNECDFPSRTSKDFNGLLLVVFCYAVHLL